MTRFIVLLVALGDFLFAHTGRSRHIHILRDLGKRRN